MTRLAIFFMALAMAASLFPRLAASQPAGEVPQSRGEAIQEERDVKALTSALTNFRYLLDRLGRERGVALSATNAAPAASGGGATPRRLVSIRPFLITCSDAPQEICDGYCETLQEAGCGCGSSVGGGCSCSCGQLP
jgi:hypothetical protein